MKHCGPTRTQFDIELTACNFIALVYAGGRKDDLCGFSWLLQKYWIINTDCMIGAITDEDGWLDYHCPQPSFTFIFTFFMQGYMNSKSI